MLELKAAPSPNPVLPAANAAPNANAANAAEGAASNDATQSQGAPFAAVLKEHLAQVADKKAAAKAADALLAVQSAAAPIVAAEAPTDPISLLAPMLSGIALPPTAPEPGEVAATTSGEEQEDAGGAAILIAAPAAPAPAAPAIAAVTPLPAAAGQSAATVDNLPHEAQKSLPASANIAATTATAGDPGQDKGTDTAPIDFESALTTAREAQVVNPHAPVRAPQAATPAPASAVVATPVGTAGWDREVGDKITWMVGRNETRAELVLNPPQLGRVEVSLSMNGDQATATFTSANATVREALENAMPRLREILQGSGISLGQTQVGAESFQQSAARQENGDNPARGQGREDEATVPRGHVLGENAPANWLRRGDGLVDTFA